MANMKDVNVSNITSVEGGNVVQGDVESNIVSNLNVNDKSNKTQSFASIVKDNLMSNFKFPERDQAILFDTIENTQKNDYIVSVGELIGPKHIIFASRIANNRICIYFSSKEIVDKFMDNHKGIKLQDKFITARRLVSPAKRVILSNVSPCIPHKVVEEHLKRAGLDVVSAITFVSAGVHNPEYKHIYSFRRQAYINLEQNNELPHTLIINFNQFAFRIFLSTDEIKCFICKKSGHLAKKCPNYTGGRDIITIAEVHPQPNNADKAEAVTEGTIVASNNMTEITTTSVEKSLITQCSNLDDFVASKKRPASPASELDKISVVEDESGSSGTVHWVEPRTKKKLKQQNYGNDFDMFEEFRNNFDESNTEIDYETFCKFLVETKGKQDVITIANDLNLGLDLLLNTLVNCIKKVSTNNLKSRLKRIIKKIKIKRKGRGDSLQYDTDTDISLSQDYSTDQSEA